MQSQQARAFFTEENGVGNGSLPRANSGETVAMVTGVAAFFAAAIRALSMTHENVHPLLPPFGSLTEENSFYNGQWSRLNT